jgi:hypothetical protein
LLEWVKREGVNMDWTFRGSVAGVLTSYRNTYRVTPQS